MVSLLIELVNVGEPLLNFPEFWKKHDVRQISEAIDCIFLISKSWNRPVAENSGNLLPFGSARIFNWGPPLEDPSRMKTATRSRESEDEV